MSSWEVEISKLERQSDKLCALSVRLSEYGSNVKSAGNLRGITISAKETLQRRINEISEAIKNQAESMRSMGDGLGTIIDYIERNENIICGSAKELFNKSLDEKRSPNELLLSDRDKDKLIDEYEKKHPEDVIKIEDFLNSGGSKKYLTQNDIREIKFFIYSADEPYRSIFINNIDKFTINRLDVGDGNAYYKPFLHTVNYTYPDSFSKDPRGAYTTFFHETGHGIDDMENESKWLGSDTENFKTYSAEMGKQVTLREAIEYDVYYNMNNPHSITSIAERLNSDSECNINKIINAFKTRKIKKLSDKELELFNDVRSEFNRTTGRNEQYEAVTDVYGGMSKNQLRNKGYGHDVEYWNDKSMAGKELWAEYFSYNMTQDEESLTKLREYFPEASQVLDQYARKLGE